MKLEKPKTKKIEIRINEDDLKLFKICAFTVGQSTSQLLRMFIDTSINALRVKIAQGEIKVEDYETLFDNKLQ